MKMNTRHYHPTEIHFGKDSLLALGDVVKKYGESCLLIVQNNNEAMIQIQKKIEGILEKSDIRYDGFHEIRPNPLAKDIEAGIKIAKEKDYDAIVAVGGGSVIDTAKVISFAATKEIEWEKMFDRSVIKVNPSRIPLITVPTTAGTGSHCTQAAVVSDENNQKHTVFSQDFFPNEAIVDYSLTSTLPKGLTSSTGFDAFCHLSESYINGRLNPVAEQLALQGMRMIAEFLPRLQEENDEAAREKMAIADTFAGISLSNGGANLPHFLGETISSHAYAVNHGCSLAICYPAFVESCYSLESMQKRILDVLYIINQDQLAIENAQDAKEVVVRFLKRIGLNLTLGDYNLSQEQLSAMKESMLDQSRYDSGLVEGIVKDLFE